MMRKLIVLILCGLLHDSTCSRMKFERGFNEPIYRTGPAVIPEAVFKREPVYQRTNEPMFHQQMMGGGQMMGNGQVMGGGQLYGGEQKPMMAQEHYMPAQQMIPQAMQNDQMIQTEHFIREPIIRGEPIIRQTIIREPIIREPVIHREPIVRPQPVLRTEPVFHQPAPVVREGPVFANEPGSYTIMVTPCRCPAQPQYFGQPPQQETFYQPIIPQQFVSPRISFQKPVIKPEIVQSFVAVPRIHRLVRKTYRPLTENVHVAPVSIQTGPEMPGNFNSEPGQYPNNRSTYQSQTPVQENTPEPSSTVTTRSVPQASSNRFPISQVSSIC
ncbi:hypothetical protein RUM43_008978 [Polyplax serrata]|uniref:Uncharacterized protein n=1 Tax=Polyplax serrata TaxID=468196 RepID=A0AAN8NPF3_POLSC